MKFDTVLSGWSMVYFEELHVIMSKTIIFSSLEVNYVLANSADHFIWVSTHARIQRGEGDRGSEPPLKITKI